MSRKRKEQALSAVFGEDDGRDAVDSERPGERYEEGESLYLEEAGGDLSVEPKELMKEE